MNWSVRVSRRRFVAALIVALALVLSVLPAERAESAQSATACENPTRTFPKLSYRQLLDCVTLDGVREHQAAFQAIADANGGIRTSGTPGYDESAAYVAERMEAAGYEVTVQEFEFAAFIVLGPSTLAQTAPGTVTYTEGTDYAVMSQSDPGSVSGPVTGVDLQLFLDNTSDSGCETADFTGFPAGNIALVQRGACTFQLKAENAAAAGAVGVIIFNQGNTEERKGLINGTLSANYAGGIPVMESTYDLGETLAGISGLEMDLEVDAFRGTATTSNVIADMPGRTNDNVVMLGAHLDSVNQGPGIQDNGSGSGAILEVAEQLGNFVPHNRLRFAWWGAEESGLIGSDFYVDELTQEERDDIALYLNFDMIGSPNYIFMTYDGDESGFTAPAPVPDGSVAIEKLFESFYTFAGEPYDDTAFSGRSDYQAFINVGIPAGGLFTGAEVVKSELQEEIWGGTAGDQFDPCYHIACDTFDNISLHALLVNSHAVAVATLTYAYSTETVNGVPGKPVPGAAMLPAPAGPEGTVNLDDGGQEDKPLS